MAKGRRVPLRSTVGAQVGVLVLVATVAAACGQPAAAHTSGSPTSTAVSGVGVAQVLHGQGVDAVLLLTNDQPVVVPPTGTPGTTVGQVHHTGPRRPSVFAVQELLNWAGAHHLPVVSHSAWSVTVRVTPAQATSVFGVTLHVVAVGVGAARHLFVAPTKAIAVPAELDGLVSAVVGMDTRPVVQPGGGGGPVYLTPPTSTGS